MNDSIGTDSKVKEIRESPNKQNPLLEQIDLVGLQNYIELIDEQKKEIVKIQVKIRILNVIVAIVFTLTCLCEIYTHELFYGELTYLGPLYLTCIVFIIALCKI